ncbi:DUF2515 family protein [Bacillus sp. M6-12]|uniref:DUF2515 family protein n=1 Tax=Bacillus sp. M6-12 TaxID=2054166 RepID=UPI0015E158C3|nr:DUF2515 family protein [Bacillus sp. M6-12]
MNGTAFAALKCSLQKELASSKHQPQWLLPHETELVKSVRAETEKWNRNNVTRTQAYLAFYTKNPEIHWSLLAHMVSRNGGYHMTDLKGSAMKHLISESDRDSYFTLLEQANAAIFSDAYPQLLLYEQAKETGLCLRRTLPLFHISRFMYPIWELFLAEQNSLFLTAALIINEQQMLENRVLSQPKNADILKKIDFQLQELLGLTAVIFPYKKRKNGLYSLTGLIVNGFNDPQKRIMTGKKLYQLLFQHPKIYKGIWEFAQSIPHTGSRADYWAPLFSVHKSPGKIYSPELSVAWNDVPPIRLSKKDWFDDVSQIDELKTYPFIPKQDITERVLENIRTIQLINEVKGIF